ncbi:CAP domain-containing protein [Streptomyces palmae]|uniref:CAP domain-containing protein n=1 Tax=Streptomyces palmae TaxID=1701085 RepID=A0A4Z0H700_9ACTN|nr:CAP domain-containing protein [Streptomyces palmae]TGB06977.1 CAP domain-containing protein [Streptomyces palmae]
MGRHRRAAAEPPAAQPTDTDTDPAISADISSGRHRDRRRGSRVPVRTGLLGASAAVVLGAAAMSSGLLTSGGHSVTAGDGPGGRVSTEDSPDGEATTEGSPSASPTPRDREAAGRGAHRKPAPSATDSHSPSATPGKRSGAPSAEPSPTRTARPAPTRTTRPAPSATTKPAPRHTTAPRGSTGKEAAAEAEVLRLVNQKRAQAGCSPLIADSRLGALAGDFSRDMAERGFFDHTDPDGATPWDRAKRAGITNMGGENIARGQADAQAVMDSWMNSPGHRANILNCDFQTIGVGAHYGAGGPWWTQEFGY